jgi:23S rRNA maturation-related 3'-5' exoribonuclease YhaM
MEESNSILKKNLSEKAYELWEKLRDHISNPCWEKSASSTNKYHRKENGRVPSVIEHTFEMLYSADKIINMFEGIINKDVIFLSIILHDSYKYGLCKTCQFTEVKHGQITADKIKDNKNVFLRILTESEVESLEAAVRFHDGKWSPIAKESNFNKRFFTPEITFLHTLDMLSSRNCLKIVEKK